MDELNSLPFLDAVVREVLRLHPSLMGVLRSATKDDVLPLSNAIVDKRGRRHSFIEKVTSLSAQSLC